MYKYEVKCKCGHVGRKNYIVVAFAVIAENGREAAAKARSFPRVKHDQKDAIIGVRKVTEDEFEEIVVMNSKDKYLYCSNRQEQKLIDLSDRVFKEVVEVTEIDVDCEKTQYFFGKTKVRKPKKFFKNIINTDYSKEVYAW